MFPPIASQESQNTLDALFTLYQTKRFDEACAIFADNIEQLLAYSDWQTIHELLPAFPPELLNENADLRYVQGMIRVKAGQLQEAINLLARAKFAYSTTHKAFDKVVKCCLELAQIYHSRENFRTAYYYLSEEIQPLIERGMVNAPPLRALFYLRMAEIGTDIGKLRASIDYAQEALSIYRACDDLAGQFYALVRIASTAVDLGDYAEGASKLELAQSCYAAGQFNQLDLARLLNIEVHLHWYRGELPAALDCAHRYLTMVDSAPSSNFRVFARILLGNLYRNAGDFDVAQAWYDATCQIAHELNYCLYYPWIDVQVAWLRTLQGRLDEARALVYNSLKTSDLGQSMSFQSFLAVINLLDSQFTVAERLLDSSMAFYEQSGDELTVCALQFHLTYVSLKLGKPIEALEYVRCALSWLAKRHIDYFPHWWHPQIVSEVCAFALEHDVYPDVAERIFVNRLGAASLKVLHNLLHSKRIETQARARHLLHIIEGDFRDELTGLDESRGKVVLTELLQHGQLQRENITKLQHELMTAAQRQTPNPTLMAVFGLYVNGYSRAEIAEKLGCSVENVRNYITAIYQHFGMASGSFASRHERRRQLAEIAHRRGFV